jgi:HSP20 family molecular chaperone IbpA
MTTFLDKLNSKMRRAAAETQQVPEEHIATTPTSAVAAQRAEAAPIEDLSNHEPLNLDVFQAADGIVIFAQAGGVGPDDFDITLDEENDILTIRGVRKRPETATRTEGSGALAAEGKFILKEVSWAPFYRRLVLPTEVDIVKAEAVFKKGVLVITLPTLKITEGRKLKVVEVLSSSS